MTGLHLSHYAIEAELGRGGMGIVFRAKDTKLNRTVALKVLPAGALASEDDRARFRREAQAAAQINHANVCHVYQVDEAQPLTSDGKPVEGQTEPRLFIAMEYIEGETLHDYVKKGPLKLQEAVNIAGQVAEALKEAHAKDIVHRDIKSANIMLTEGGVAKVLDFGLAKTNQSTMLTRMGSTLGTVAYMSPEQARGQEVDGRSDLYSLGTVLYEMIAGRLPYSGDYEQAMIYGILNEPPEPLTSVRTGVPMQLEWIVEKLLAKEVDHRYQSAAGLLADFKSLDLSASARTMQSMPAASGAVPNGSNPGLSSRSWALAAVALLLGAISAWLIKPVPAPDVDPAVKTLTLELPGIRSMGATGVPSDDGRLLAITGTDTTGRRGLHVVDMETGKTSLVVEGAVSAPAFPKDGTTIVFEKNRDLFTVPISGGTPEKIVDDADRPTDFLDDNSLLYTSDLGLWLLPPDGAHARRVTEPDSSSIHQPSALPGNRFVIVSARHPGEARATLEIVDIQTGDRTPIGFGSRPIYLPSGHLIYGDATDSWRGPLFVRPFDLKTRKLFGAQEVLFPSAPSWLYEFDSHGTLYHRLFAAESFGTDRHILARSPTEKASRVLVSGSHLERPRLEYSGRRIAGIMDTGEDNLIIYDPDKGIHQQITFSGGVGRHAWSGDGERMMLQRDGSLEILSTRGSGLLQTLPTENVISFDWSRDGRWIVYQVRGTSALRLFDIDSGLDTLFEPRVAFGPSFSADGLYIAYTIVTGDALSTDVRRRDGGEGIRLSVGGAEVGWPRWSPNGDAIFVKADRDIARVPVTRSNGFSQTGPAEVVLSPDWSGFQFDVGADETVYYTATDSAAELPGEGQTERVIVVMNWLEQVKRLAPSSK